MPVGATRPISVDVRVIAASHRDLEDLVLGGKFRADLLARVSGIKVVLPPLRERREDLGLLIGALLRRVAPDRDIVFEVRAARAIFRYGWPLNIRELEKCLAAAVVLAGGELVEVEHLPPSVATALEARPTDDAAAHEDDGAPLGPEDEKRKKEIVALLEEHKGNVSAIARVMGKARMQIQRWLKRYRLDPERFR
jgi:transcriptional regulator with GAF, ATPase, and Fis domain